MNVRAIQHAFRRHVDTTPTAYLRMVRLQHAREQLRAASAGDGVTVARVALEWGFRSPSRFATRYREAPGETLRR